MTQKQMLEQALARIAAMEQRLSPAMTPGPVITTVTAPATTMRAATPVSWFTKDRATEPGELHVAGATVASMAPRTKLVEINTGRGKWGMETAYVPQAVETEAFLVALRSGAPIDISCNGMTVRLVR